MQFLFFLNVIYIKCHYVLGLNVLVIQAEVELHGRNKQQ